MKNTCIKVHKEIEKEKHESKLDKYLENMPVAANVSVIESGSIGLIEESLSRRFLAEVGKRLAYEVNAIIP